MKDFAPRLLQPGDPEFPVVPELSGKDRIEQLWVRGRDLRELASLVAIVGSRKATPYGLEVARALAADFASAGACVASGMAFGIDAAAHEGALSVSGQTIAVLGSGVDVPSPNGNATLYDRILASGGAIVSEYPLGTPARPDHYPFRNRIIVTMSRVVVIVQGELRGGTAHTASWATKLNRTLYAVPGDVRSPMSALPHDLIKTAPCAMLTAADDAMKDLDLAPEGKALGPVPADLAPELAMVLTAIGAAGSARAEDLSLGLDLEASSIARSLTKLELRGFIARDLGSTFRRIR